MMRHWEYLLGVMFLLLTASACQKDASSAQMAGSMPGGHDHAAHDTFDPSFQLTDHNGVTVSTETYAGKYQVVFFGFTNCPDVCPIGLSALDQAMQSLDPELEARIQPILITVDPDRDTPEVLKYYVGAFHERLQGLTGSQDQIDDALKGFRVFALKDTISHDDHYLMGHSTLFYVIDPEGNALGTFNSNASIEEIAAKIVEFASV